MLSPFKSNVFSVNFKTMNKVRRPTVGIVEMMDVRLKRNKMYINFSLSSSQAAADPGILKCNNKNETSLNIALQGLDCNLSVK